MDIQSAIAKSLVEVVGLEEDDLRALNKGIFYMPELSLAYSLGKKVFTDFKNTCHITDWQRETSLEGAGPTDIVFRLGNGKTVALELKMRQSHNDYYDDIEKLSELQADKYIKIFAVLVDAFSLAGVNDGRIRKIEDMEDNGSKVLKRIGSVKEFTTKQDRYSSEINCVVLCYEVQ